MKFSEAVQIRKMGACTSCATFIYSLPTNLTMDIESFLLPFGKLSYNLSKCKIVRMDNEIISISDSRIGKHTFKVKFKKDKDKYKELFDIHIAAFIEKEMGITIEL